MSKDKIEAEKKRSASKKTTKEKRENISQAEDAKELAKKIFSKLKRD